MVAYLDDPAAEAGRAAARTLKERLVAGQEFSDVELLDLGVNPARAAVIAATASGTFPMPLTFTRPPLWFRSDVPAPPGWLTPDEAERMAARGEVWRPGGPFMLAPHVPVHYTAAIDPDGVRDTRGRDRKRARREGRTYALPDPSKWLNTAPGRAAFIAEMHDERRAWWCTNPTCDGRAHLGFEYPHARADQWPTSLDDDAIRNSLALSGRGAGKTAQGAAVTLAMSAYTERLVLVAPTWPDLRDVMIGGPSGLLRTAEKFGWDADWEPSKHQLTFPNGSVAYGFTAEEPDRLRGTNAGAAWLDEPCHFADPGALWDAVAFVLREGRTPKITVTSTPKPSPWLRALVADKRTKTVTVSTFANAENLAPDYIAEMRDRYDGTRIGDQELHGRILTDVEGALLTPAELNASRVATPPELVRVVVGVDPAGSTRDRADSTGIIVLGRDTGGHLYVLADRSGRRPPDGAGGWAPLVFALVDAHQAAEIVAERNYGGDMVESILRAHEREAGRATTRIVVTQAQRSKAVRAEPLIGRFQQGRVHIVGRMSELEEQLTGWVPGQGKSPDRLDALVWAFTVLDERGSGTSMATPRGRIPAGAAGTSSLAIAHRDANYRATQLTAQSALSVWSPDIAGMLGTFGR